MIYAKNRIFGYRLHFEGKTDVLISQVRRVKEDGFHYFLSLFFSGGGKGPQIAILHPRQLSVYSITKSPGKNKKSLDNFQITLIYAHKLSRSAFSMVIWVLKFPSELF